MLRTISPVSAQFPSCTCVDHFRGATFCLKNDFSWECPVSWSPCVCASPHVVVQVCTSRGCGATTWTNYQWSLRGVWMLKVGIWFNTGMLSEPSLWWNYFPCCFLAVNFTILSEDYSKVSLLSDQISWTCIPVVVRCGAWSAQCSWLTPTLVFETIMNIIMSCAVTHSSLFYCWATDTWNSMLRWPLVCNVLCACCWAH